MLNDKLSYYSKDQAETTAAAHDSTNVMNMGANVNAFGTVKDANYGTNDREAKYLNVIIPVAFTSDGAATLTIALHDSLDGVTYALKETIATTVALTALTADDYWTIKLPNSLRRYSKLVYTIGTAAMTAGTLTAWIGENYNNRVQASI